ncbi:hypothetical protein [Actinomycetospora straminea]|uniref:Uncharacterized protein n=1 Tax=Actinomycetospora straminea TaxID=663607 RepID=A0ABP9F9G0_9PSEU|nr:hypothetical protein [Actinomycetospora straminea]MDD7936319.1 hypothetical protein [Actinomycetospora straminea]
MTVSHDLAPLDGTGVRAGVAQVRAAIADGSLHHHAPAEIPAGRRSRAVEVVRAWAAGEDAEAQRRHCGVCATWPVAPRSAG